MQEVIDEGAQSGAAKRALIVEFEEAGEQAVRDRILRGSLDPRVERLALDWIQAGDRSKLHSSHVRQLEIVSCAKESAWAAADLACLAESQALAAKRMATTALAAAALAMIGAMIAAFVDLPELF